MNESIYGFSPREGSSYSRVLELLDKSWANYLGASSKAMPYEIGYKYI